MSCYGYAPIGVDSGKASSNEPSQTSLIVCVPENPSKQTGDSFQKNVIKLNSLVEPTSNDTLLEAKQVWLSLL